jgi:hypothetical protein
MKKWMLAVALVFCFSGYALAAVNLPPMHAGIYYSFKDKAINHVETFDVLKIKDMVTLEVGYAGDADESDNKLVSSISVDIEQLKLGNYIKLPILDLMAFRPAVFLGLGHINSQDISGAKLDYGIGATLISLKF